MKKENINRASFLIDTIHDIENEIKHLKGMRGVAILELNIYDLKLNADSLIDENIKLKQTERMNLEKELNELLKENDDK